jgi:hypothetical protein
MHNTNANEPGQANPDQSGEEAAARKEDKLLARVKDVAQRINDRVRQVLSDTELHKPLGTEENPPVA